MATSPPCLGPRILRGPLADEGKKTATAGSSALGHPAQSPGISFFPRIRGGVNSLMSGPSRTGIKVYGCNHIAIEVDDIEKAVAFYKDVFNLEQMSGGEGDAFFKLGEHQFLAMFEVRKTQRANVRHFGIMVRDPEQLEQVREKLKNKYQLKLIPPFRCDFHDPWGNRIQVVDLHDESLIWLLPYREVQKAGIKFDRE